METAFPADDARQAGGPSTGLDCSRDFQLDCGLTFRRSRKVASLPGDQHKHRPGRVESACTAEAIAVHIEPFGACYRRRELRPRVLICLSGGAWRQSAAPFCLGRSLSQCAKLFYTGLLNGCLQLRYVAGARTGFGKLRHYREHDGDHGKAGRFGLSHRNPVWCATGERRCPRSRRPAASRFQTVRRIEQDRWRRTAAGARSHVDLLQDRA